MTTSTNDLIPASKWTVVGLFEDGSTDTYECDGEASTHQQMFESLQQMLEAMGAVSGHATCHEDPSHRMVLGIDKKHLDAHNARFTSFREND